MLQKKCQLDKTERQLYSVAAAFLLIAGSISKTDMTINPQQEKKKQRIEWSSGSNCEESDKTQAKSLLCVGTEPSAFTIHWSQVIIKTSVRDSDDLYFNFQSVQLCRRQEKIVSFVIENIKKYISFVCQGPSFPPPPPLPLAQPLTPPTPSPLPLAGSKALLSCVSATIVLFFTSWQPWQKVSLSFLDWIKSPNPTIHEGGAVTQRFFVYSLSAVSLSPGKKKRW